MAVSIELQSQFCAIKPGKLFGQILPGDGAQDRIVSTLREVYAKVLAAHLDISLSPDKVTVDLGRIAIFKAAQLLGQATIKRVRDHRHHHIEVNFDEDRRREGIEVEEFDGFGNAVLNPPPTGVVADYQHYWPSKPSQLIDNGLEGVKGPRGTAWRNWQWL